MREKIIKMYPGKRRIQRLGIIRDELNSIIVDSDTLKNIRMVQVPTFWCDTIFESIAMGAAELPFEECPFTYRKMKEKNGDKWLLTLFIDELDNEVKLFPHKDRDDMSVRVVYKVKKVWKTFKD